ncbi:thioredoxin domain protein [Geoanaerobacter pelophilus]|uniref:Thioredoxin domain protein n=1 Tax=Geoanaerobacter pelophilus TaxID=60036 RepID=A0ABQ0MI62_9BACT|nr:thioredoxin domain protein [Geoanaerobacter pelophilus]
MAELLAGEAAVVQINSDESPRLSARFMVRGIPVVHLLCKGSSVDQLQGAQSPESVVSWFRRSARDR